MLYNAGNYDVAVIGAGHAGIESALAAARLGCRTAVFTLNLDWVGNMACNPSVGGTSKGHLVREIDALGGEMGKAADKTTIQSRMLNMGKGPAVHSLRAQVDRREYTDYMKYALESQGNLDLKQAEICSLEKEKDGGEWVLTTKVGAVYRSKTVIIATGTFLKGKVFIGDVVFESGPDGMFPSNGLADSLSKLKIPLRRFKTGTPARINSGSVDLESLEVQYGDEKTTPFSFSAKEPPENKTVCHITYTSDETKEIILNNIHRSPLYQGEIEGVGPRYCPSIEDKIMRFADKDRHQVFIEPCGLYTNELYLAGLSSSLPEDVQIEFIHSIPGLQEAKVMRPAYAIEYDCADPLELRPTLEFIRHGGLYGAGQFNGSSGYEEAAAQGLIAGINAAHKVLGREPFILDRASSYIGTLIDDLVTKGCTDPYRMMTSRSEYRLALRQDNADLRLTDEGYRLGLIDGERYADYLKKKERIEKELKRAEETVLPPSDKLNGILISSGEPPLKSGVRLSQLLKRPGIHYETLSEADESRPDLPREVLEQVEIHLKYEGYIKKQEAQIKEMRRLEGRKIPDGLDYEKIKGLRKEAAEKLERIRPENVGQASRISGVTPADISVLIIYLSSMNTG